MVLWQFLNLYLISIILVVLSAEEHKTQDGTYKCPDCGSKFKTSEKFDEHRGQLDLRLTQSYHIL